MSSVQILHNPRCSKSRQTLTLLQEKGIDVEVTEYLKHPLTREQLEAIATKLGASSPRDMMRTKETEYKELALGESTVTDEQLFDAMVSVPKLIERPVVIKGNKARIGRPPESVLDIL